MRTAVQILADFDDPRGASPPLNEVDSVTSSIRRRVLLETLLDIREELVEMNSRRNKGKHAGE